MNSLSVLVLPLLAERLVPFRCSTSDNAIIDQLPATSFQLPAFYCHYLFQSFNFINLVWLTFLFHCLKSCDPSLLTPSPKLRRTKWRISDSNR